MAVNVQQHTAKIYQFPLMPRRKLQNGSTVVASPFDVSMNVVDTSCWYHDDAVHEAEEKSKPS